MPRTIESWTFTDQVCKNAQGQPACRSLLLHAGNGYVLVCQLSVASLFVSLEVIEHRLCFKTVIGVVKAAVYSKHFGLSINKC